MSFGRKYLLFLCTFLALCAGERHFQRPEAPAIPEPPPTGDTTPDELRRVRAIRDRFDQSLRRVAGNDPLAQQIADYYFGAAIFGRPRENQINVLLAPGDRAQGSLIIALGSTAEFTALGDASAALSPIRYRDDIRVIIMNMDLASEPWAEHALLHEVFHAHRHLFLGIREPREQVGRIQSPLHEEAMAHAMERRLLDQWTHGAYLRLVTAIARERPMPERSRYYSMVTSTEAARLDTLFQPAVNQLEHRLREAQYGLDVDVATGILRGQPEETVLIEAYRAALIRNIGP